MPRAGAAAATVLIAALAVGAGWRALWAHGAGHAVSWRDATAGLREPLLTRPTARLFHRRADLAAFLRREDDTRAPTLPAVDFSRDDAALISPGPPSSTGYSVRIVSVTAERARLLVIAHETTPSLGTQTIARLTVPVRLLVLPKLGKPLSVRWEGR